MKTSIVSRGRFWAGLILGPLITVYLIPLGNCALSPLTKASNCWIGITGFTWYGLPIAIIAIALAAPISIFALRLGWVKGFQSLGIGALIATLLAAALSIADESVNFIPLMIGLTPLGSIAAFIFWLIGLRCNFRFVEEDR